MFKIKQIYHKALLLPVITALLTIAAVLILPTEDARIIAGCVGGVIWVISFFIAAAVNKSPTRITVGKEQVQIKHILNNKKIQINDIKNLIFDRYSVTHYVKSRGTSYEEYRVKLVITAMGRDGTYDVVLNDEAFRMKKGFRESMGFSSSERVPDEEVPLYSVYKLIERRVNEAKENNR